MTYAIGLERGDLNYAELEPLYKEHYAEMTERLERDGHTVSPFAPRLDQYFAAWRDGWLLNFVVRKNGEAVGYANAYITNDMHNGDLIAQEDAIFVRKEHRNGVGMKLMRYMIDDLRARGVKRGTVQAVTDLRVAKIWRRMGFQDLAATMVYHF